MSTRETSHNFETSSMNLDYKTLSCTSLPRSNPSINHLTWSLALAAEVRMNSVCGINAAEVRVMEVLETGFLEAQRQVVQKYRRVVPGGPGVRSEPSGRVLRFGPAGAQLRGEDALDAEV